MGEVYRATDSRLRREVAIKVLPAVFTSDPERLARFEREAQLLAQLHHPNIASIFGLEEADGVRALVMELVEGEDLAACLARGPLPLDEALGIACQIVEALEAAHEKGIVHRDLKPANVKVRPDGTVKVLDFGLAKALEAPAAASGAADVARSPTLMNSPTLTAMHGTQLGVILGTAPYMAPEQVKGLAVDARADIWAFGVVLWEMLTGRRLFGGDSTAETLAGVLKSEIDLAALPAETPPSIRRLLRRCLARNPKERLHDIADARLELAEAAAWKPEAIVAGRAGPAVLVVAAGAALVGALLGALAWRAFAPGPASRAVAASPVRLAMVGSTAAPFSFWGQAAISPDGERVAFVGATADGMRRIYVHELAEEEPRPLAGTEHGFQPFWSPDGRQLGFFAHGQLVRIDVHGGPPRNLCPAPDPRGGSWSRDGTILFNGGYTTPLSRVPAEGGTPVVVTQLGPREEGHTWPSFLPDGRHFVFLGDAAHTEDHHLKLGSLDSPATVELATVVSRPVYADPGYVLYVRGGALLAQRLDVAAGKLAGDPVQLATQISQTLPNHGFELSASAARLTYRSASPLSRLQWLDRAGRVLGPVGEARRMGEAIALSPDARRVAWEETDADGRNADIWVRDLDRGLDTRVTFDPASDFAPVWSPAGDRLIFVSYRSGGGDLYVDSAFDPGNPRLLYGSTAEKLARAWSRHGVLIAVDGRLRLLPVDPPGAEQPLVATTGGQYDGSFSRDGRWLAYESGESGRPQVFLQPYPPTGRRWQVSVDGGTRPRWRADGRELYFRDANRGLEAVAIDPGAESPPGAPRRLFTSDGLAEYDVAPDGQRFLVESPVENADVAPVTVLTDWRRIVDIGGGR